MKILVISPFFPPLKSVATVRIDSLTKYLAKKNYKITVLTNNMEERNEVDSAIETINVNSTTSGRFIINFFLNYNIYKDKVNELLKLNEYDAVIITMGPFYTLPLCKYLTQKYNLKCILDFRDLFVFEQNYKKNISILKQKISKMFFYPFEKSAVKYAYKVVTVTEGWSKTLKKYYSGYSNKIMVIENGYDDNLLIGVSLNKKESLPKKNIIIGVYGKLGYYSKDFSQ